jgi:hypothetical protein
MIDLPYKICDKAMTEIREACIFRHLSIPSFQ